MNKRMICLSLSLVLLIASLALVTWSVAMVLGGERIVWSPALAVLCADFLVGLARLLIGGKVGGAGSAESKFVSAGRQDQRAGGPRYPDFGGSAR